MKFAKILFTFLILVIGISLFFSIPAQAQETFIRGDINCDGVVDTVDLGIIFRSPNGVVCYDRFDVNDDGSFTTADSIYLANYLFSSGPPPPHPFPACGLDTTAGGFGCQTSCCCTLATECNDGLDNDGDGFADFPADCGCTDACDSTEASNPVTQCNDGIDNDGDGWTDLADQHCANICDTLELCDTPCCYKSGDVTGDGKITLTDIIADVNVVFKGAPKPDPPCRGDCNNSNTITLPDIIILIGHIFKGAPKPAKDVDGPCCR